MKILALLLAAVLWSTQAFSQWNHPPRNDTTVINAGTSNALKSVSSDLGGNAESAAGAPVYLLNTLDAGAIYCDQVGATAGCGLVTRHALGTAASPADVTNNLQLGYIDFRGYSGTKYWQQGSIAVLVDGTFTTGQAPPSRMAFYTNNANGPSTEAFRINKKREVLINTTAQNTGFTDAKLTVKQTNGTADYAMSVSGSTTAGGSFGFRIDAGTNASDYPFWIANQSGTGLASVRGDGLMSVRKITGTGGTLPTMGACGTSPTIVGTDLGMQVTVGTGGVATSCAVTFGIAFANAPVCVAQNDTDRVSYSIVTATGTVTVTATAAITAGSKFNIICIGR